MLINKNHSILGAGVFRVYFQNVNFVLSVTLFLLNSDMCYFTCHRETYMTLYGITNMAYIHYLAEINFLNIGWDILVILAFIIGGILLDRLTIWLLDHIYKKSQKNSSNPLTKLRKWCKVY